MKIKDITSLMEKSKTVYPSTIDSEEFPEIRAFLNLANPKLYTNLKDKYYSVDNEIIK